MTINLRKYVTIVEEVHREGARTLATPLRFAAAIAVITNPYAGRAQEDLSVLGTEYSSDLGPRLADMAAEALGKPVEAFGKAALVGLDGETQHGSSVIHTRLFGDALRRVGQGVAPVPAAEKRGYPGATIDVSLKNVQDPGTLDGMIGSHVFSWTVTIPDAPAADEIMVISAVASGGRPHAVLN